MDHAPKLCFLKFLASNQNGRCLLKKSVIVGVEEAVQENDFQKVPYVNTFIINLEIFVYSALVLL